MLTKDWSPLALAAYRRAVQNDPKPDYLKKLAYAASRAGLHGEAAVSFERAWRATNDPELKKQLDLERTRALSAGTR
jgi:hypothetical protein